LDAYTATAKKVERGNAEVIMSPRKDPKDFLPIGRPPTWTDDDMETLVDSLRAFQVKSDSLDIISWRAVNNLTRRQVQHFCDRFPFFACAYEICKAHIQARRLKLTYTGEFSEKLLTKQEWIFDDEVKARIDELRFDPKDQAGNPYQKMMQNSPDSFSDD